MEEIALDAQQEAAERFEQLSLRTARLDRPARLISLLEDTLRGELGHVARAKGVLPVGGEMLRFDLADGLYAVIGAMDEESQCVFIGEALDKEAICLRLGTSLEEESFMPAVQLPDNKKEGKTSLPRRR